MKACPRCGFRHLDLETRCVRCNALLDALDPGAAAQAGLSLAPVRRWSAPLRAFGAIGRVVWRIRAALSSPLSEQIVFRNPWWAGLRSLLLPGWGQWHNGQPKKMAMMLLGWLAALALVAQTFFQPASNGLLLGLFSYWIYAGHEAFMTAKRINRDTVTLRISLAFYAAWWFYAANALMLTAWMGNSFLIERTRIFHNEMAPYLKAGEMVALDRFTYLWRKPRLGEVVMFDPARFVIEIPGALSSDAYVINAESLIERIVGMPGDTFERRAGQFFRNGQPVDAPLQPIVRQHLPDFKLTAPADHYIVLVSYTGQSIDPIATGFGSLVAKAPPIDLPGAILQGWDAACVVPDGKIAGRVLCVYNPPESRRILR